MPGPAKWLSKPIDEFTTEEDAAFTMLLESVSEKLTENEYEAFEKAIAERYQYEHLGEEI